jgi:hypothetical protein
VAANDTALKRVKADNVSLRFGLQAGENGLRLDLMAIQVKIRLKRQFFPFFQRNIEQSKIS